MSLTLSSEQQLLRDNAREFLRGASPVGQLRRLRDQRDPNGFSRELWSQMAELGFISSALPEALGGMGLGYTELGIVLEECGRNLASTPLLSCVLLGAGTLLEAGDSPLQRELLPLVAAGKLLLALAFEEAPRFQPYHVSCRAERVDKGYRIHGHKRFVLDGASADKLIVSARTSGAATDREGISLFLIDAQRPGVQRRSVRTLDSRCVADCKLEAVEVPASQLIGALGRAADVLDPVLDRATVALSAEMLGLNQQAYETTLEYLKTRVQFDVPIGSFQALQHRAVEMFCALSLASSVVYAALSAIDERSTKLPLLASAAKARMTDTSRLVTREAVQMHGGIGMTDEHDIGFFMKRGAATELTFGDSAYHRDRFARLSGF
ncbi:MAG TPA: acyl-CoA dehydrogenase family protein [Polyangiales bacterium]|jgi:acyl-CoA dehydrogenase|nr:acyl-CoA dehydrogenase family protein [Polyangiales bacterium]